VIGLVPCARKLTGSNPTLATEYGPWTLHLQLPVALWCVNSDTVSML